MKGKGWVFAILFKSIIGGHLLRPITLRFDRIIARFELEKKLPDQGSCFNQAMTIVEHTVLLTSN
jgi:hypothetical protein